MEGKNVCKDCGNVKISPTEKRPATGNVCKECGQAVKSGEGHEHKKEE